MLGLFQYIEACHNAFKNEVKSKTQIMLCVVSCTYRVLWAVLAGVPLDGVEAQ